jgi:20S proteasome alpha/beta subunit
MQDKLSENLVLRLTRNIETQKLDLILLVAGVDSTGGHIHYIRDPGTSDCFDAVGFCAIGSGEHHAELTFIRSEYSPRLPLNRAVFLAYQAKRDAEMAPGVGSRYTDIGVIDEKGLHFLNESVLAELGEAYKTLMECHTSSHSDTQTKIDALNLHLQD